MQDMNRVLILILIIGLLYALYKYQNSINDVPTLKDTKKKSKMIGHKTKQINNDPVSNELLDSDDGSIYKQDSGDIESLASGASLSFIDENSEGGDSLFFS